MNPTTMHLETLGKNPEEEMPVLPAGTHSYGYDISSTSATSVELIIGLSKLLN